MVETGTSRQSRPLSLVAENHEIARYALTAVNAAGVIAAVAFAATGVARPNYIEDKAVPTPLANFWAASSAVRTWAIATPILLSLTRRRQPSAEMLAVAGAIQLGDSALGVWQRNPRMTIAPALMGLIHLFTARLLSISER